MKTLAAILLLALASCTPKLPPRAILLPPAVISAVDTRPVESAAGRVSDGAEKVAEALLAARDSNTRALDSTARMREAMDRVRFLAQGNDMLQDAIAASDKFTDQLFRELNETKSALELAEEESAALKDGVKSLAAEVSVLKSSAAVNKAAGLTLLAENKALREQAEQGNAARDQLVALQASSKTTIDAQKKWMWRLGIASGILTLAVAGLGYLLLKP